MMLKSNRLEQNIYNTLCQQEHTHTQNHSPGADPHEGDGGAGKEDRHEEKGLPAPDV